MHPLDDHDGLNLDPLLLLSWVCGHLRMHALPAAGLELVFCGVADTELKVARQHIKAGKR